MWGGSFAGDLVFVQVVEVEIEQTCRLFNVLVIQRYNGASVRMKPFKSSSPQSNVATDSFSSILWTVYVCLNSSKLILHKVANALYCLVGCINSRSFLSRDSAALLHTRFEASCVLTVEDGGFFDWSCHNKYVFNVITWAKVHILCELRALCLLKMHKGGRKCCMFSCMSSE